MVEVLMAGGSRVSGEPLPELSATTKADLEIQLQRIGIKIARSPERLDGWEDAYNAFVEAFERRGGRLSPRQIELDLPNMLFNFALKNDWFPHLTLLAKIPGLYDITSPNRFPQEAFCVKTDHKGVVVVGKRESLDWFKDRIRPGVMEWRLKHAEPPSSVDANDTRTSELITAIEAVRQYKRREGLAWKKLAKQSGVHESTLRQRICNPNYKKLMKKDSLELLAQKIGCEWSDLNWPRKNQPLIRQASIKQCSE